MMLKVLHLVELVTELERNSAMSPMKFVAMVGMVFLVIGGFVLFDCLFTANATFHGIEMYSLMYGYGPEVICSSIAIIAGAIMCIVYLLSGPGRKI